MSEKPYQPPEDQIAEVLKRTGSDPRKLAIAYLRARKEANASSKAMDVALAVHDAREALHEGDLDGTICHLEQAKNRLAN